LGGTGVLKSFTSDITGLSANTTYYVKAYATNAIGTTYSDAITFTTLPLPTLATVQTLRAENVKHNQIDGVGNIVVLGDGLITDYGFCYSTSNANPTTGDSKQSLGQTTQTGNFTVTVTGLQASTKYYLRAYAVNSMGAAYGGVVEATTTDAPPVVTSGLVAYYTFDGENCNEAQGKTEYNGVKQGNGNPVWSTDIPGKSGKSLHLSNDIYYQMPTSPSVCGNQWSYSIWLKATSNCFVFQLQCSNTNIVRPIMRIYENKISAYFYNIGYNYFNIDIRESLLDGDWHMLTITKYTQPGEYSSSAGRYKLYIDGTYYANLSGRSDYNDASYPLQLGNGFTGKMDNLRIYNRELTQAEITEIYNAKQ
jgi:hypothetical protein